MKKRYLRFGSLVIQPTTLCQLDCSYCYLPDRKLNKAMSLSTVAAIIDDICGVPCEIMEDELVIFWYSGEPLLRGIDFYSQSFEMFLEFSKSKNIKVTHCIQTNGVLISKDWCNLFLKFNVQVGVSIDGDEHQNKERVNFAGKQMWDKIMRGINILRSNNVNFGTISVLDTDSDEELIKWYNFIKNIGSSSIGVNFVEKIGTSHINSSANFEKAWNTIFQQWRSDNFEVNIKPLNRMGGILLNFESLLGNYRFDKVDLFAGIAYNGNISLLSPEFV